MTLSNRTFGWLRDGIGNLAAAREIEDNFGAFTFGNKYYVNPDASNKSDDNLGTSKAEPLETVSEANDRATTNNHDIIYMSGNSAHALTTELAVTKNRVHFVGAGGPFRPEGQRTRWEMGVTTGSEIALCKNTGNGNTFHNIKMRSTDTNASSLYTFADGGEHTLLDNCALEKDALLSTTTVAELLCNGDTARYEYCTIGNTIYQISAARQGVLFTTGTISGKAARDVNFKDCTFLVDSSSTTYAFMRATVADIERYCLIKDSMFLTSLLSSATVDEAIAIASALTQGVIILKDSFTNATNMATASSNVFTHGPAANAGGSLMVEAS